jgi:hypothetical protein
MKRRIIVSAAVLIVGLIVVLAGLPFIPTRTGLIVSRLPFAWVGYFSRTLPKIAINWNGIAMVLLCSAIAIPLLHSFCSWFYASKPSNRASGLWTFRATFGVYAGFWLLFVIVIAASGLLRTTQWVLKSSGPLYRARPNYYAYSRHAEHLLAMVQLENKNDIRLIRANLLSDEYSSVATWEDMNILLFPGVSNELKGAIIVPRDPERQRKYGFSVVGVEPSADKIPMERLPEFISLLESTNRAVALSH